MLYSELKREFENIFSSGNYPNTLLFSNKSAYIHKFKDTVEKIMIARIDRNLAKLDTMTPYEDAENRRTKKRLLDILEALKDRSNWNVDLERWREDNCFYSFKFSEQSNLAPLY